MKKLAVFTLALASFIVSPYLFRDANAQYSPPPATTAAPSGAAGGGLAGTYPNPTVSAVPCSAMPALTGDTTATAGTCATTTSKVNGTSFLGTTGNLVSFGASNTPADSGLAATGVCGSLSPCLTGSLSQAQIVALNTTPVQILAAQGAGTIIIIDAYAAELVFNTAAYTGGAAITTSLGANAMASIASTAFKTGSSNIGSGTPTQANFTAASTINIPLTLATTVAYVCGSTCGTITYWVRYHVVTGAT